MYLIDKQQYFDVESGFYVVDELYSSVNPKIRAASGTNQKYENSKTFYATSIQSIEIAKISVYGYFSWNSSNDTATVSNAGKTVSSTYGYKNGVLDYQSNQGFTFLGGKKYAYARYTVDLTNNLGGISTNSVYVDVNKDGEVSRA